MLVDSCVTISTGSAIGRRFTLYITELHAAEHILNLQIITYVLDIPKA